MGSNLHSATGPLQCGIPSESQPLGEVPCCRTRTSTACRWDSSPPLISEGCCLTTCRRGMAAAVCLLCFFLTVLGVSMVDSLMSHSPKNKSSQTKGTCPTTGFPLLHEVLQRSWLALPCPEEGLTWSWRSFSELLTGAYASSPIPKLLQTQIPPIYFEEYSFPLFIQCWPLSQQMSKIDCGMIWEIFGTMNPFVLLSPCLIPQVST